jgi:hypothetical protein
MLYEILASYFSTFTCFIGNIADASRVATGAENRNAHGSI